MSCAWIFRSHAASAFTVLALLSSGAPSIAQNQQATAPLPIDWENLDHSVLDLSSYLEAPAGRDGFLRVEGNHLVKPDGSRFRLWGVNIVATLGFPEQDEAKRLAADLARLGINCVRFHGLDAEWGGHSIFEPKTNTTRKLDPESLDRLDYFISQLKNQGIYSNLNLNVFRRYRPGDNVRDAEILGLGKSATYFNPRLVELQHEYARQLLTHKNAYTGNEYRHEPAIGFVELVNENSVLEGWVGGRLIGRDNEADDTWSPIPVSYDVELTDQFNAWLKQNVTPQALANFRKEAGLGPEANIPRLRPDQFAKATPARFRAEAQFYFELEQNFFQGMNTLLKDELEVEPIVLGTADHNDGVFGYPHIKANMAFPLIDGHGYWEHPRLGAETWIKNTPMVNDPLDSTVVQFARTPVLGRPYTISETNHPFPHQFSSEGLPILTAYALLHDWDGLYWFTWKSGRSLPASAGIPRNGWFDLSADPVKVATIATCGLLWHRQDVAAARQTIVRSYTDEQLLDGLRMDRRERPFFTPGFARSTPLQHATRWTQDASAATPFPPEAPLGRIVSDTGELSWLDADQKTGYVTLKTPRAEALIGHVKSAQETPPHLSVGPDWSNPFTTLLLTSTSDQPITSSERLLLLTGSRVENTGQTWKEDGQTLADWGTGPVRVEPLTGTLVLTDLEPARSLTATPLSPAGVPAGPAIQAVQKGANWNLTLEKAVAPWWLIEVSR